MTVLLVLIAIAVTLAVGLLGTYIGQRLTASDRQVRRRLAPRSGLEFRPSSLLRGSGSRFPLVESLPLSAPARERMALELQRAGQEVKVGEYLAMRMISAVVLSIIGAVVAAILDLRSLWIVGAALLALIVGWFLPRIWLANRRSHRRMTIEGQLPEALTAMAKALRAGSGLLQALAYAAEETPAPLGPELQGVLRDLQLGADPEIVFGDLSRRVGSSSLDIAVTAIVIQRNAGGNLAEILSNVTNTIRERFKLEREIYVMTSRQRLMGNMVGALPVLVAILFLFASPDLADQLFKTGAGRLAIAIAVGFEVVGLILIRRLAVVDV